MAFLDTTKDQAFARSGGQCECKRLLHGHGGSLRCPIKPTRWSAEYHHLTAVSAGGNDGLSNCQVLCHECHVGTDSYGRH
jgi:5-methylcytosine-specific restriction endonuclease McrA